MPARGAHVQAACFELIDTMPCVLFAVPCSKVRHPGQPLGAARSQQQGVGSATAAAAAAAPVGPAAAPQPAEPAAPTRTPATLQVGLVANGAHTTR